MADSQTCNTLISWTRVAEKLTVFLSIQQSRLNGFIS